MPQLPPLEGRDFVDALRRLGFRVTSRAAGLCTLARRVNAIVVPEMTTLSPRLIGAMLRSANVDPTDFVRAAGLHASKP